MSKNAGWKPAVREKLENRNWKIENRKWKMENREEGQKAEGHKDRNSKMEIRKSKMGGNEEGHDVSCPYKGEEPALRGSLHTSGQAG